MQFMSRSLVLLSLMIWVAPTLLINVPAWAEEEAAVEEEGAAQEEEVSNGYGKKLTKYNTYQSEIKTLRASIQDDIKKLNALGKENPERKVIRERIVLAHDDLESAVKKYNEVAAELRHQFPEKDDLSKGKYLPYRKQSLEQIERELDLDDILTEAGKLVNQKYRVFLGRETADEHTFVRENHKKKKKKSGKDERIEVNF